MAITMAGILVWRTLSGPSSEELVWQAMQQAHRQVKLPESATLAERQATEPGFWSSICFGVTTGCPRDERVYVVNEYRVSAQRLRGMLVGLPITSIREQCPVTETCRVSGTVEVNKDLAFVLEVYSPRDGGGGTTSALGVRTTPTD